LRHAICFGEWEAAIVTTLELDAQLPAVGAYDAAQIQYTSGTTGTPKGALLHHRGLVNNARFIVKRLGFPDGGVWVTAMPLFHTAGCAMSVLGCVWARATLVLCQYFDAELVLGQLERHHGDCLFGVPTMLIAIADHPRLADFDIRSCSLILSGGSTVPPDLVRKLETSFDARFSIVYGQTESSPIITQTSPDDDPNDKANTIGRPLWQVDVKIVDPATGSTSPVGEQGELCARGYQVMLGYYDMPDATERAVDADGWLHTGDLATMDGRGYVTITGRLKDMIIRGGENIYPREIEDVLAEHPAVAQAAVYGVADAKWGEKVAAAVILKPGARTDGDALTAYLQERIARHKVPKAWRFVASFPVNASGKIQKFMLRESHGKPE
jgi:acyl-CoA synthetase (AMP-forming)/AMP-acid ligase II